MKVLHLKEENEFIKKNGEKGFSIEIDIIVFLSSMMSAKYFWWVFEWRIYECHIREKMLIEK